MQRIFLSLASLSTLAFVAATVLGLNITDASPRSAVSAHILTAMGTLGFACLVHAIVFTYFMGTSRWMEDTTKAYRLDHRYFDECRVLKYRVQMAVGLCTLLIVTTVIAGGATDTAAMHGFRGWFGLPPDKLHLVVALTNMAVNLVVYFREYVALHRNGVLVSEVLAHVRRIREERNLPVS